jgi:hypothetical protein
MRYYDLNKKIQNLTYLTKGDETLVASAKKFCNALLGDRGHNFLSAYFLAAEAPQCREGGRVPDFDMHTRPIAKRHELSGSCQPFLSNAATRMGSQVISPAFHVNHEGDIK